jgi:ATP synthase I chain
MTQTENNGRETPVLTASARDERLHTRVFRTMIVTTVLAVLWSVFFTSWLVTTGLLIGGLLALLNHRWLQTSISAAFGVLIHGEKPRITLTKYIIRYFIVGVVVFAGYTLGIASLPAIIAGLCTFVVALFVEAIREMYFAIIQREEIS